MDEQALLNLLKQLAIESIRVEHPKLVTMKDYHQARIELPDQGVKNLFLRNKKGNRHYLVIVLDEQDQANLEDIAGQIEETRLSFASTERLKQYLGVEPGCVTPFALVNDTEHKVTVLLDEDIRQDELLGFHPIVNSATECISYPDLIRFLDYTGHTPKAVTMNK